MVIRFKSTCRCSDKFCLLNIRYIQGRKKASLFNFKIVAGFNIVVEFKSLLVLILPQNSYPGTLTGCALNVQFPAIPCAQPTDNTQSQAKSIAFS